MIDLEQRILDSIRKVGEKETLIAFTSDNNEKIMDPDLDNGWKTVRERSIIFNTLLHHWFENYVSQFTEKNKGPYHRPFALVTGGGFGRMENCPNSDNDIYLLADDIISLDNKFLEGLKEDILYNIPERWGLTLKSIAYNLDDIMDPKKFDGKNLNTFLDMRTIYDSQSFSRTFRDEVKKRCDTLELLLHNRAIWMDTRDEQVNFYDYLESFNLKDGPGGLRSFQIGVWAQAIDKFQSSEEIYQKLSRENPKLLESAGFLLKMRSWLHLYKEELRKSEAKEKGKDLGVKKESDFKSAEIMTYPDLVAMGERFGGEARARLIIARRRIHNYTEGILHKRWKNGIKVGELVFCGINGLYPQKEIDKSPNDLTEDDKVYLNDSFYSSIFESHRRGIQIDPSAKETTFRNIEEWLRPDKRFVDLFYENGRTSVSLNSITSLNIMDRFIEGYSRLETSIPELGHRGQFLTRTGFAVQKLESLEEMSQYDDNKDTFFPDEYNSLDINKRAGLKLALWLKRMPEIFEQKPREYFETLGKKLPFTKETLEGASFLVENHDTMIDFAKMRLSDDSTINKLADICKNRDNLRTLMLFTYADYQKKQDKEKDPHLWFNVNELYHKTRNKIAVREGEPPQVREFDKKLFDDLGISIYYDLGPDFHDGGYGALAKPWINNLCRVYRNGKPIIKVSRTRNTAPIVIACRDYPGLMAVITGNMYENKANLLQSKAYTLSRHGLAFDFFDVGFDDIGKADELMKSLEKAITEKRFIDVNPEDILGQLKKEVHLEDLKDSGYLRLTLKSKEDRPGILYALSNTLYRKLEANIFGLGSFVDKNSSDNVTSNSIYFRTNKRFDEAQRIVRESIG